MLNQVKPSMQMKLHGVTIVHKPSKVIAQIGRHNVPLITSADKGKTHSVLACVHVSASRQMFSPFMIYPRKQPVPEKLREGAYPNTEKCKRVEVKRENLDLHVPDVQQALQRWVQLITVLPNPSYCYQYSPEPQRRKDDVFICNCYPNPFPHPEIRTLVPGDLHRRTNHLTGDPVRASPNAG